MDMNRKETDHMHLKTETEAIWTRYAFLKLGTGSSREMTANGARAAELLRHDFAVDETEEIMVAS
jgi:hypothetical protein